MSTLRIPHQDSVFSVAQDCERLRQASQRPKDRQAIIWILGHRDAKQRKEIKYEFEQRFNQPLIDCLQSALSGEFKEAVRLWMYDPPEMDARLAESALKTKNKKKIINQLQVIVELACASQPQHLMAVRQTYCRLFDCSLEEDIASNITHQSLRKLLLGVVRSYRYDKEVVESDVARSEAARLHEAIEKKQLEDDSVVWILGTRNFFQLKATFEFYKEMYNIAIDEDVSNSSKDDLGSLVRIIVLCINSPEKYFAEVLNAATLGSKTDTNTLTRVILRRAESDLMEIKKCGNIGKAQLDNVKLDQYHRSFLMTLLGEKI